MPWVAEGFARNADRPVAATYQITRLPARCVPMMGLCGSEEWRLHPPDLCRLRRAIVLGPPEFGVSRETPRVPSCPRDHSSGIAVKPWLRGGDNAWGSAATARAIPHHRTRHDRRGRCLRTLRRTRAAREPNVRKALMSPWRRQRGDCVGENRTTLRSTPLERHVETRTITTQPHPTTYSGQPRIPGSRGPLGSSGPRRSVETGVSRLSRGTRV